MNEKLLVSQLYSLISKSLLSFLSKSIDEIALSYKDVYLHDFEEKLNLLKSAFLGNKWPEWWVNGLVTFNRTIIKEEILFKKHNKYSKTVDEFDSINQHIYSSSEAMNDYYLIGLFLSYYTWPHHFALLNFFRDKFLVNDTNVFSIADWGAGHGLFSLEATKMWPKADLELLDISKHSLNFAKQILTTFGVDKTVRYKCENLLDRNKSELSNYDVIICCELLEHVATPNEVLKQIYLSLNHTGKAFVTAAINAPQPDHIYLFRNKNEVIRMINNEGLEVIESESFIHPNKVGSTCPPELLAMCVVRK